MKLILSFATEDFVTPEHDDVLLRLSTLLTRRGIPGSFHLTGDLARTLRRRRRTDVLRALARHEIGYHSNTHGAFPFLAGLCESRAWDDAVAEIMATEARGLLDLCDLFDRRPAYYVTEFATAPQVSYALKGLGLDLLGFSSLPPSENRPCAWYAGSLCLTAPHMGLESPPQPGRLERFREEFDRHAAAARHNHAEGLLKLFNHPYKFLYDNRVASWVGLNRIYRAYDPHADWIAPQTSRYDRATTETLFREFEALLDHVQAQPDVKFLRTSDAMNAWRRRPPAFVPLDAVRSLARAAAREFSYHAANGVFFSPAEIFGLLVDALDHGAARGSLPDIVPYRELLAPVEPAADAPPPGVTPGAALTAVLQRLNRDLDLHRRLPALIDPDGIALPPENLLAEGAALLDACAAGRPLPDLRSAARPPESRMPRIAAHPHFQETTFTKPSYPEGFTGSRLCSIRRLQSWSYKPATRC